MEDKSKSSVTSGYYRPLTKLSFFLDFKLWGESAFAFHLENIIFHLITLVLSYYLALRLSGSSWTALAAAAIFGLYPVHVESKIS